jgi:hypothetical protein
MNHGVRFGQALERGPDVQRIPYRALYLRTKAGLGVSDQEMDGVVVRKQPLHQAPPDEAGPARNGDVHGSSYCMRNAS